MAEAGRTEQDQGASERLLLIIAGPTASGKSALAMALARRLGGTVINADAMQCYRELRILTARPSLADEDAVPHLLYGVRAAAEPANAAWWRGAALAAINQMRVPILCGGTGLYLSALLNGIAEVPDPGEAARAEARRLLGVLGPAKLHARLAEVDPDTAAKLRPGDSQRIARAYEVWRGTGKGLVHWQSLPTEKLHGWGPRMVLLDPPREELHTAIETRFAAMLTAGALNEIRDLLALNLDPALPLMRAHGVQELAGYLNGETSLPDAAAAAIRATHQYTKRQATWFRHQALVHSSAMQTIHARIEPKTKLLESLATNLTNFINRNG